MIGLDSFQFFNYYLKTDSQTQIKDCEQFNVHEMIMRSLFTSAPSSSRYVEGNKPTASGSSVGLMALPSVMTGEIGLFLMLVCSAL